MAHVFYSWLSVSVVGRFAHDVLALHTTSHRVSPRPVFSRPLRLDRYSYAVPPEVARAEHSTDTDFRQSCYVISPP